jgi:hypothetical protein
LSDLLDVPLSVTNAEVVETQMQTVKKLAVLPSGATAGTGGENTVCPSG